MDLKCILLALSLVLVPAAVAQDDLEQRVEILEVEVTNIKDNVDNVETDVASLETDVSQTTGQLFEVINDVDDIDELTDAQEHRIGALEEENSLLRAELDDLKLMFSSLTVVVNDNVVDIQALNETVSDLDIESDNSTNERLDALESDVTTLESDVTTLESDVTTLEGGLTQLESDVINVEQTVQALNTSTDQRLEALEENKADYSDTVFLATISAVTFAPNDPIVWDTAILNPGGHYSTTLGVYTVPVDGIYQFVMHYHAYDSISAAYLEVDNVKVAFIHNYSYGTAYPTANLDLTLSLTSGQQVWISPYGVNEMLGTEEEGYFYSWFSGHLIYPL